jgi:phosphoribosylformylglycinamidine (FGAM) synthase PurS component
MKVIHYKTLGIYRVVDYVSDASIDPEATMAKAAPFLREDMSEAEINEVLLEHADYGDYGSDADIVEDSAGNDVLQKLEERGKNRQLTDSLEYIPDYTGTEYWIKHDGVWGKEKITEPGIVLPDGAISLDVITNEQHKEAYEEIKDQEEKKRIALLTDKEKEEEMAQRLKSAARKVLQDAEMAELMGESYDKASEYAKEKTAIESAYALS